jgi:hypothetical protein
MKNFDLCVNYKPCTDGIIISCKLGLWSIKGSYSAETAKQAEEKYKHFKALGKYNNLLREKTYGGIKIMEESKLNNGLSDEQFKQPKYREVKKKLFSRRSAIDLIYLRKLMKIVSTAIDTDVQKTLY